jgi:hypothetical protein
VSSSVLPEVVYRRAKQRQELPDDLRLRAIEWALYFAVDGKQTAAELGRQLRAEIVDRDTALTRLADFNLIEEQPLDASEYVRALAAAGDREERSLREYPISAAWPAPTTGQAEAPPPPERSGGESAPVFRVVPSLPAGSPPSLLREVTDTVHRSTLRQGRTAQPAFGFKPLPIPNDETKEKRSMSGSRRLSLRALMNLIERQADSREAGQLDIYRVFVRVDTLLLKRNGIETLRFTDDRLVSDPELEQALIRSVKKTLGVTCPESIWVEVA